MAEPKKTYTQQEVTEILKRALRQQSLRDQELGHDDLVQMAGEVGIDRDALDRATAELAQSQAEEQALTSQAEELAEERGRQLSRFTSSLLTFAVAGIVFYFVNKQLGLPPWVYWILIAWGALVLLQIRHVVFPQQRLQLRKYKEQRRLARAERRAKRWAWKNDLKQAFTPQLGPNAVEQSSKEFERAVQAGVAALLGVAARKIQEHADRKAGRR